MIKGINPLVCTVSGHPQFLALWCGHHQSFSRWQLKSTLVRIIWRVESRKSH